MCIRDSSYTQLNTGTINIELGGTEANTFDTLNITGAANLDGTLNISLIDGFVPSVGDTFEVINYDSLNGSFNSINGLDLGGGLSLDAVFSEDRLTLNVV